MKLRQAVSLFILAVVVSVAAGDLPGLIFTMG